MSEFDPDRVLEAEKSLNMERIHRLRAFKDSARNEIFNTYMESKVETERNINYLQQRLSELRREGEEVAEHIKRLSDDNRQYAIDCDKKINEVVGKYDAMIESYQNSDGLAGLEDAIQAATNSPGDEVKVNITKSPENNDDKPKDGAPPFSFETGVI